MKTDLEIVRGAIEALRQRGHVKDTLGDILGRVCAQGALNVAHSGVPYWTTLDKMHEILLLADKAYRIAQEQFPERCPLPFHGLVSFNNHPDTTVDDVILVFEKLAVELQG